MKWLWFVNLSCHSYFSAVTNVIRTFLFMSDFMALIYLQRQLMTKEFRTFLVNSDYMALMLSSVSADDKCVLNFSS